MKMAVGQKDLWPGTPVAKMTEGEFEELFDLLEEPIVGERGGTIARVASFLGFWRASHGANLRVGLRQHDAFVATKSPDCELVKTDDKFNLILRQAYMPDLPHDQCVVQLTWRTGHWFEDNETTETEIAHTTSCAAEPAGTAAAVNLPIFHDLKARKGLNLNVGIYAMADRGSQPILDLLGSSTVSQGLQLAGKFNSAFAMTVPYIGAAISGLTKLSKRNFKLASWPVGFGVQDRAVPLAYGDYILLDGMVKIGRQSSALAWSELKWDPDRECVTYQGGAFRNPYLILGVERSL
jgi:hypothetical protein